MKIYSLPSDVMMASMESLQLIVVVGYRPVLDAELFRNMSDSSKCKDRAVKGMFHCLSTIDWDYIYVMFKFCDQSCRNVSKGDSKHYQCIFVNA